MEGMPTEDGYYWIQTGPGNKPVPAYIGVRFQSVVMFHSSLNWTTFQKRGYTVLERIQPPLERPV